MFGGQGSLYKVLHAKAPKGFLLPDTFSVSQGYSGQEQGAPLQLKAEEETGYKWVQEMWKELLDMLTF